MFKHVSPANPLLKDVWQVSRIAYGTYGLALGLMQFVFYVFLYDKLGADALALKKSVFIFLLTSLACFFLEVPIGALGDYIGRKKTVVFSFFAAAVAYFFRSWIYFAPSPNFAFVLAITSVLFHSISYTLFSGSFVAWIVDTVKGRNVKEGYGPLLARGSSVMLLMKIVGAMIGMSLFLSGYVFYVFALSSIIALLCAIYCGIMMKETEALKFHGGALFIRYTIDRMVNIMRIGFKATFTTPPLLYLLSVSASFTVLMLLVNCLWPIAMKTNFGVEKMTLHWFFLVLSGLIGAFLGSKFLEFLQHNTVKNGQDSLSPSSLWLWTLGASFFMGVPISVLGFLSWNGMMTVGIFTAGFVCFNIGYGFIMPGITTLKNHYIPIGHSAERATILSWQSMITEIFVVALAFPSSGPSGEKTAVGWILPASLLIISALVVNVFLRRYQRKVGELPAKKRSLAEETVT